MSDFSRTPLELLVANQQKGYVGIHIQQGVPLLDRDLNLLHDLVAATVRSVITRYVGNGLATGADGFIIQPLQPTPSATDFVIGKGPGSIGTCLVGGIEVVITADTTYTTQPNRVAAEPPLPNLNPPVANRVDTVFLDVWLGEVDGSQDADLTNSQDVGMETAVRLIPLWVVRVAEGSAPPSPAPIGHAFYTLARLNRAGVNAPIDAAAIEDQRQGRLTMSDMERRLDLMERLLLLPQFATPQFLPRRGGINQVITLNGVNFNVGTVAVRFGNQPASIVGAPTADQITVQVPPGLTPAGTAVEVPITVITSGGSVTSTDRFQVLANPAFAAPGSQFSPPSGTQNTVVTLNGFNFNVSGLQVRFNAVLASLATPPPTANQIRVTVPAAVVPPAGSTAVSITVQTTAGAVTSDDTFNVVSSAPPLVWTPPFFSPRRATPGSSIALLVSNATPGPATATFASTTTPATATTGITIPAGATSVPVTVPVGLNPGLYNVSVTIAGTAVPAPGPFQVDP